jgi:hypothetical protein
MRGIPEPKEAMEKNARILGLYVAILTLTTNLPPVSNIHDIPYSPVFI